MTENEWFFDKRNQTKDRTKSNNVYDLVSSGYSVLWSALDEQGRYEVWSVHVEAGGEPMNYPEFCDLMDRTEVLMLNIGDNVRVVHVEGEVDDAEVGYEGTIIGTADNGDDYLVRITDRSKAVSKHHPLTEALMQALMGDELTYPAVALERI